MRIKAVLSAISPDNARCLSSVQPDASSMTAEIVACVTAGRFKNNGAVVKTEVRMVKNTVNAHTETIAAALEEIEVHREDAMLFLGVFRITGAIETLFLSFGNAAQTIHEESI